MKKIAPLIPLLLLASITLAAVDWKPRHNDKPVPEEQAAKIKEAVPKEPIVEPKEPRKVLVYSHTAGFRHKSIPHGKMALEKMGESTGAYEAVISDDPANFEADAIKEFDVILFLSPTQDMFMPSRGRMKRFSDEEKAQLQERHKRLVGNLLDYVNAGGGVVGIHAATDACYNDPEYGEMMGGYFDGHPWRANTNVTIRVEDPEHELNKPVFGDVKDFSFKEEIYQFKEEPYSRDKLRILLNLDPERSDPVKGIKRKDNDFAVAWVQKVGEGRVFYSSLGHNEHIYWNPMVLKHYLAGIQFAAGDLPADTTPSAVANPREES
jgi:hypothetical protein